MEANDELNIKEIRSKLEAIGENTDSLSDEELIKVLRELKYHKDKTNNRALKKLKRMLAVTFIKWMAWCLTKNLDKGEFNQAISEVNKYMEKSIKELTITKKEYSQSEV